MSKADLSIKQEMYDYLENNNNILLYINVFLFLYLLSIFV